ncbi:MAG TPA: hypothetical protein VF574_00710 [Allosphingosinicella sp.]|jgi:hypothetical protein
MDAPRGRYSVIEKDGRLVVIDNGTGAPIPSSLAPPPAARGGTASTGTSPVAGAGPGTIDVAAGALLAVAAKGWDSEGRAIIAWRWEQNEQQKRWDAVLDERQQRRMGRALLALCLAPPAVLLLMVAGGSGIGLLAVPALLLPLWGALSLRRLYRETNDPSRAV